MWNGCPELQQYVALAADRHHRLLADAAAYRRIARLKLTQTGYWHSFWLALAGLLLLTHPAGRRPAPAASVRSSIEPSI